MTVGRIRAIGIWLKVVGITMKICIPTILEASFGRYDRNVADRRSRWWCRKVLGYVGATVEVHGPASATVEPGRPTIIMSNHASLFDIPVIYTALPGSIRMIAKKELFRIPIFGRAMRVAEFVCVDRSDHARAVDAINDAGKRTREGIILWLAPEGTRSRNGQLGPFKKGGFVLALQTGARIIPVGIRGTADILPPTTMTRVRTGQTVHVHVGEPVDASAYTVETRSELIDEVRRRILALVGQPDADREAHAASAMSNPTG